MSDSILPFFADDLRPGERLFTRDHAGGDQRLGYDFSARRIQSNGTWTATKRGASGKKNDDFLIQGRPFYAMADGEVEAAWRNAPENPTPGGHHPDKETGLIAGGGNMLRVREADGVLTLYAHAQPGTIPSSLCPHEAELFSAPGETSEMDIPPGSRPTIKAGQFLGRCGNSGRSSGPHLHVHKTLNDKAHPISFASGLSTPWNGGKADIDAWTRFAGKPIPRGEVLVWPSRRLASEYARHSFKAADYGRIFAHLSDSGFQPIWFDGYSVGDGAFFNFVWRPADRSWRAWRDLTAAQYQERLENAIRDGFAPVHVESYLSGGKVRYALIVNKGVTGKFLARHGLTVKEHDSVLDEAKRDGLNPVNVSVASVGGKLEYTVLYRSDSIGSWVLRSRIPANAYQKLAEAENKNGRRPHYIAAYMHNSTAHFSVMFASASKDGVARHDLTSDTYQEEWSTQTEAGRQTQVVTGYDGAKRNHRFAATWR